MFFSKTEKKPFLLAGEFFVFSLFSLFVFNFLFVFAAPDQELTYHGKLTDIIGLAVPNDSYDFTLTIYDSATGSNCLWTARGTCGTPDSKELTVTNGIFSTTLGESGDNALDIPFNDNYYLEVQIGSNSPMSPRRKITPTGFALNAHRLNGFTADNYIDTSATAQTKQGDLTVNGTLTLGSNILPDTDDTYTLGDSTHRWQDLYLGSNSLHIGEDGDEGIISYDTTNDVFSFDKAATFGTTTNNIEGTIRYSGTDFEGYNGTSWLSLTSSSGSSTFLGLTDTPSAYTNGSILFTSVSAVIEDNAHFFWDNITKRLGIGTNTPVTALDVNGGIKFGTESSICNATFAGTARYNSTSHVLELCNGTTWTEISSGSGSGVGETIPAGTVVAYTTSTCPTNWVAAEGQAISRTSYPDLFTTISTMYGNGDGSTTFNVPDYRGEFLRGWAHGSTNDPDRATRTNRGDGTTGDAVGTKQANIFGSHLHSVDPSPTATSSDGAHTHTTTAENIGASGSSIVAGPGYSVSAGSVGSAGAHTHTVDILAFNSANTGGNETRPRNVNVLYCIKSTNSAGGDYLATLWDTDVDTGIQVEETIDEDIIRFDTAGVERMTLGATGNLGLGTTAPSSLLDLQKVGTTKANTDMLELTNSGNAADMDATSFSILFNQYYYDATTPTVADSARLTVGTEQDWISTATTQDSFLSFSTALNGVVAEKMRINSEGNLGIGTLYPSNALSVVKSTGTEPSLTYHDGGIASFDAIGAEIAFGVDSVSPWATWIQARQNSNVAWQLALNPLGGNVGIGTNNPGYPLTVNGQPAANGYTAFTNYSDKRLKENKKIFTDGYLEKIMQLKPTSFNYNELSGYDEETRNRTINGFIAQELQQVFPDMIGHTTINGIEYLDTNLSSLPIFLTKAIQEQQHLIQTNTNELTTKATATSLLNLQNMTEEQFTEVSGLLRSTRNDDESVQDDIIAMQEDANTQSRILDEITLRIAEVENMHAELFDFYNKIDADQLVFVDKENNLTIDGMMITPRVETDTLVITGKEDDAMIGEAVIVADTYDVFVPTTAVVQNSRIFVTPKNGVVTQTLSITRIDERSGFHVTVADPTKKPIMFDWLIVEDHVVRDLENDTQADLQNKDENEMDITQQIVNIETEQEDVNTQNTTDGAEEGVIQVIH